MSSPADDPAALDDRTTEELREQAYAKAKDAHDVGFFWDLAKHHQAARAIAGEDGSSGNIAGSLVAAMEAVHQLRGHADPADEPLLRARYLDYLRG